MAFKKDFRVVAAASTATLYTVPLGTEASAPTLTLTAVNAGTATITIFDNASGLPVNVISDLTLAANEPWSLAKPLMLNEGDQIRVSAVGTDIGSVLGVYENSPSEQAVIFNARGIYSGTATYNKGDVVESGGSTYIRLVDEVATDIPPSVNWMLLAEKGDAGPMDPVVYDPQLISGDTFARINHTGFQTLATISDAGTAAPLDVPATGDAAAGEVVKGDDTRLSDARTPTAHTHVEADITDLGDYQVVLTEGAFVDGDKTKLNGIEALADVTDTVNVTAAGALMDSEVTNLNAVKAFDPADYATGAEGDLAATALQPGDAVEQTSATGSAVLPVGTTAQRDGTPATGYLRYNSTDGSPEVYDGTNWVPVGGGGGGLVFITSSDLSSDATADFTAFDATKYDAYKFILQNIIPASDMVSLHLLTSTDGDVSFDNASNNYIWTSPTRENITDNKIVVAQNVADAVNSDGGINGTIQLYGPQVAKRTVFTIEGAYFKSGGFDNFAITSFAGTRRLDSDVDAVRFLFSSGNISSGTITMYGMVNA